MIKNKINNNVGAYDDVDDCDCTIWCEWIQKKEAVSWLYCLCIL